MDEEPQLMTMNTEELDDKAKDQIICKILEGLFQKKDKVIEYKEEELKSVERSQGLMEKSDLFLRISTLSFQIFMRTSGEGGTQGLAGLTKEADRLLEQLKRENISQKLKKVLSDNLNWNKIITLLHRNKYAEALPLIDNII